MKQLSNNFKKLFLLQFTRELIFNSDGGQFFKLQALMDEQVTENQEDLIQSIKSNELKGQQELEKKDLNFSQVFKTIKPKINLRQKRLTIPEAMLPPHLQYLKPTPQNIEIDLEKLNPLIKDPAVKVIECYGADEHIIVRGSMGVKPTNIIMNKEDIDRVIETFSKVAYIPIHEGAYRVVAGRLILSSIISSTIGSKFIIKKMLYTPNFQRQAYPAPGPIMR
jgi:hypothetical protein